MKDQFKALLSDALEESGYSLQVSSQEVAAYAAERTAYLSTLTEDVGFMEAVRAERDNVAMFAAVQAGEEATAADNRILGIIQGALAIGASLLVGMPINPPDLTGN